MAKRDPAVAVVGAGMSGVAKHRAMLANSDPGQYDFRRTVSEV